MEVNKETLVIIPVINEKENLESLIPKILSVGSKISVLIIDDNSSDGTYEFIKGLMLKSESVIIHRRHMRLGIGSAHVTGLKYAINNDFEICITMDGDQTHNPKYINNIYKKLIDENLDLVLTSRFIEGGGLEKWSLNRKILTNLGHLLTKIVLRSNFDVTSGMRGYRVENIPGSMLNWLQNSNYEYLPMSFFFYKVNNKRIGEIPIVLPSRVYGNTKISFKLVLLNIYCILAVRVKLFLWTSINKNKSVI